MNFLVQSDVYLTWQKKKKSWQQCNLYFTRNIKLFYLRNEIFIFNPSSPGLRDLKLQMMKYEHRVKAQKTISERHWENTPLLNLIK